MPLRIIESNKGGKILVDETSRTYGLLLTKKTNPPHIWYCKNKYNKSIKCQATCVTNGLDSKLSSITRNAGAHHDLCTPKSEIDLSFQVSKRDSINTIKKQPKHDMYNLHNQQMYNVSEQCIEADQSSKVDIALKAPEI
jgi:hypothetical protein